MSNKTYLEDLKIASPLGKKSAYEAAYNPGLLYFIPRSIKREEIGIINTSPFLGVDIWNAYELSWLNDKGKPMVAIASIQVPCSSLNLFESKSLKLYLVSLTGSRFSTVEDVKNTIEKDLSAGTQVKVSVEITLIQNARPSLINQLPGYNIDGLDITIDTYQPTIAFLITENNDVEEELNSDLLKSNCLVTNQPDWGSVYIHYQGKKINHAGLLKYIVSLREHNEFHEQCVERIFMNILQQCKPNKLTVYARYTRRGGIDINPFRSTEEDFQVNNARLVRQ